MVENYFGNPIAFYEDLIFDKGILKLHQDFERDREELGGTWADEVKQEIIYAEFDDDGPFRVFFVDKLRKELKKAQQSCVSIISEHVTALRHSDEIEAFLRSILNRLKACHDYCSTVRQKGWPEIVQGKLEQLIERLSDQYGRGMSDGIFTFATEDSDNEEVDSFLGYRYSVGSIQRLYEGLADLGLFDRDEETLNALRAFVICTGPNPQLPPIKINKPIEKASFIIVSLRPLFDDWTNRKVAMLRVFEKSPGAFFTEGQLNTNSSKYLLRRGEAPEIIRSMQRFIERFPDET